jgi:hypothetical protein
MKNKHLLLITATIAFLTFYIPVVCFTDYVNHIPLWVLPIFWVVTQLSFWFNEMIWRTSRFGGDTYNMFHQIHFDGKEWKNRKADLWLVISKFTKWWIPKFSCIIITGITLTSLFLGLKDMFNEVINPFLPYYVFLGLWWVIFAMSFFEFKEKIKYGYVSYGKRKKPTTHFSQEWHEEEKRIKQLQQERSKNSKK